MWKYAHKTCRLIAARQINADKTESDSLKQMNANRTAGLDHWNQANKQFLTECSGFHCSHVLVGVIRRTQENRNL